MSEPMFFDTDGNDRRTTMSQCRSVVLAQNTPHQITATYFPDGYVEMEPERWFNLPSALSAYPELQRYRTEDGFLVGSIGGLLIDFPDGRILIDAGFGPEYVPRQHTHTSMGLMRGGFLDKFSESLTSLDAIVLTHLHPDHIGWLVHSFKYPTSVFRETTIYAGVSTRQVISGIEIQPASELASSRFSGLRIVSTPGHSPEHISLIVDRGQERLVVIGDVMHTAAQVSYPELSSCFDADPTASRSSRLSIIEEISRDNTIGFGGHFSDVVFGRIVDSRWYPVC